MRGILSSAKPHLKVRRSGTETGVYSPAPIPEGAFVGELRGASLYQMRQKRKQLEEYRTNGEVPCIRVVEMPDHSFTCFDFTRAYSSVGR